MGTIVQFEPKDPVSIVQSGSDYVSDNGEIKATFTKDATTGDNVVAFESRGRSVKWTPREIKYIDPDLGFEDVIVSADNTSDLFILRDYHARYDRHFPDVQEWFRVEGGKLKHYFALTGDQRPPLDFLMNPFLSVGGVLEFDADLSVRSMGMNMSGSFQTSDSISIVDADGREVFSLPAIAAWAQNDPTQVQRGTFFVEDIGPGRLSFSIGVPYSWLNSSDRMYPVIVDPTVIVSSAYDTSGNGGRKIVRLSNNWIVSSAFDSSNSYVRFFVSKDNGQTWSQLTYISQCDARNGHAIASSGTTVYVLTCGATSGSSTEFNYIWRFDATTVGSSIPNTSAISSPDSNQNALGTGCSLTIDSTGALHAAWCSKNTAYPNSFNIRYSKSTNGGTTWATPTQLSTYNTSGQDLQNPCIVVRSNNLPTILCQYSYTANTSHYVYAYNYNGTNWASVIIYSDAGSNHAQSNPCSAVDSNDVIHVVWHGTDATYTSNNQIKYSKSTDGGSTWSAMVNLTTNGSYAQQNPSITIDPNNNLYVFFNGFDPAVSASSNNVRKIVYSNGSWGSVTTITSNTTGADYNAQTLWSKFNMNSSDAIRYMWMDLQASSVKYDSITLNSPPNAPTNLSPSSGSVDRAQVNRLSWLHNDTNGDVQSKFDLQYSTDGGTTWTTVTQTTPNQYWDAPANTFAHGNVTWKVRTYDPSGAVGPYSSQVVFLAGDKPAAPTITSPANNSTVTISKPTVQWSSIGQVDFQLQVIDSNSVVFWDSTDTVGTGTALTLGKDLLNSASYTLKLRIKNSDGIWSDWASSAITVSFTPPAQATVSATSQNASGYVQIAITNPAPSGSQPDIAYNDIHRSPRGQDAWTRIATNVAQNSTFQDYSAPSGQAHDYKVTAVGNNGTSSDSAVKTVTPSLTGAWISLATDPEGTVYRFKYDGEGRSADHTLTATMMAFEGRTLPVADVADQETQSIKITVKCRNGTDDLAALRTLLSSKQTVLYRDGRGRKIYGFISALPEQDTQFGTDVDLTIQAVDYQEAV